MSHCCVLWEQSLFKMVITWKRPDLPLGPDHLFCWLFSHSTSSVPKYAGSDLVSTVNPLPLSMQWFRYCVLCPVPHLTWPFSFIRARDWLEEYTGSVVVFYVKYYIVCNKHKSNALIKMQLNYPCECQET